MATSSTVKRDGPSRHARRGAPRVRARLGRGGWLALGVIGVAGAAAFAAHSSLFSARDIRVAGVAHLSRARVVAAAGVGPNTNVLFADASAIERRLESDAWIDRATVVKRLPSTLFVDIVERAPVVAVPEGRTFRLLAGDGTDLGPAPAAERLPVARSAGGAALAPAASAAAIAPLSTASRAAIASVVSLPHGDLSLRLRTGARIALGAPRDAVAKAEAVEALLRWSDRSHAPLARADVTTPASPIAILRRHGPSARA